MAFLSYKTNTYCSRCEKWWSLETHRCPICNYLVRHSRRYKIKNERKV